jgi:2-methylcitrate dehydratase PrpD
VEDTALTAAGRRGATLAVDGETETVTRVTGDPDQPMSEADAVRKFRRFASPLLGEAGATHAIAAILEDAPAEGLFG